HSGSALQRYAITPGATPAADALVATTPISITAWNEPPQAQQPNGQALDVLDGRFSSATIQNGTTLFNVHSVQNGHAGPRVSRLSTPATTPLATTDLFTASDDRIFNVSVATNSTNAFVTATRTWPSQGAPTGNAAMVIFNGPSTLSGA